MEQNTRDIHGIKFIRDEDFILREIAGEAVLVPVGENTELSNSIISLNETSVFLWKLFDHPVTYDEVLDELGNIRSCTKLKYVKEANSQGAEIAIIDFDKFLSLFNMDREKLNEMADIDLEYLKDKKYSKR